MIPTVRAMLNVGKLFGEGKAGLTAIIWGILLAVVLLSLFRSVVNNFLRSPLRRYPGPLPAKLSKLWLLAIELSGRRALYVHSLHKRYGPVVRVGPNELSFASGDAVRDIYMGINVASASGTGSDTDRAAPRNSSQRQPDEKHHRSTRWRVATGAATTTLKTFPKSAFYDLTRLNIGSIRDEAAHRAHLRRIGHCFSPALMPGMEPVIRAEMALLLDKVEERRGAVVDVFHWFRMFSLDVASHLFIGKSVGALASDVTPKFVHYLDFVSHTWLLQMKMPVTFRLLKLLPIQRLQLFLEAGNGFYEYGEAVFREYLARNGRNSDSRLPIARLLAGNTAKGEPPLPDAEIATETTIMIAAGTDTTGTTLAYLFFELARHPQWYARLRAEVCAAAAAASKGHSNNVGDIVSDKETVGGKGEEQQQPQPQQHLSYAALQALPVLHAVLWETLRVYPAAPAALPREVPRGGAPVPGSAGSSEWLPAGTVVSAQAYTVQRNADVFPQPDAWLPARWIARTSSPAEPLLSSAADTDGGDSRGAAEQYTIYETDAMRAHMQVFSRGVRTCLGKSIAQAELALATAALAQRFAAVRLADATQTVADMRVTDRFLLAPAGKRCHLIFE